MMTPVYLNPPSSPFSHVEQANDQDQRLKLFISSSYTNQAAASSCSSLISSFPTFFDSFEDQRAGSSSTPTTTTTLGHGQSLLYHHKVDKHIRDCGTSIYDQASSSSSLVQPHVVDVISNKDHRLMSAYADHEREINGRGGEEEGKSNNNIRPRAVKWMSSKMRLMEKMTNPDLGPAGTTGNHIPAAAEIAEHKFRVVQYQENSDETSFSRNSNKTTPAVRVCSDCNTSTTPLWRSGPRGPKSLCNACGIRQRKARRAMAEAAAAAANGFVVGATDTSSAKGKVANKEKKPRGSHSKKKSKLIVTDTPSVSPNKKINSNNNKICFKGLGFQRVFPQDVAEAAILLMELSCGLINHS
ncbi:putative GATA transcription factor 22 [Pyrus x bretschneideri]|uniref:putative GATA transcription factor 22 n=1 Tax=Pyrus x bretschneideri TaxID=225117 RepID=UPI00202DF078|nr:putative GATA transcription factor 22 [Pyrus x bretschneideri]